MYYNPAGISLGIDLRKFDSNNPDNPFYLNQELQNLLYERKRPYLKGFINTPYERKAYWEYIDSLPKNDSFGTEQIKLPQDEGYYPGKDLDKTRYLLNPNTSPLG